ncbi:MAG: hypothetical protein GKS07_08430 [Nitrosopumilus sp.]|nr:MAG: hypothetical protein GKS07_08430 [Nitrosopumilus sp.]
MSLVIKQSPKDEIKDIQSEINSIENGLTDQNLVKLFSETKKSCVLYLAERYERLNELGASPVLTNQIANFLVKKFETLKVKIHHSTVYDNLPQKYKTHTPNPVVNEPLVSDNPNENSSLHNQPNCEEENQKYIAFLETHMETIKMILSKLKTNQFVKKKGDDGNYLLDQKMIKEDLSLLHFADKYTREAFDDRKTMPTATQHLALSTYVDFAAKHSADLYVTRLKEYGGKSQSKPGR